MSTITVDVSSETPLYVQIMDQVRALVRDGVLAPGTALPPVRALAANLEVNPNTVARAYSLLERDGVVRTAGRRGTRVSESGAGAAARSSDARLSDAIDRMLDEARHLGLGREALLEEVRQRLEGGTDE